MADIRRTSPSQEILFGPTSTGGTTVIPSFVLTDLGTPASDSVFGELSSFDALFGRGVNDSIWGYDQSLSPVKSATNVDAEFGQTEPRPADITNSILNTLAGNPLSGGNDRFILGDRNRSFYTNNGYNDFAFIADFNPKSDVIQLNGSRNNYDFVNIPVLGEAIFRKTAGSSQSVYNGDLIGVVLGASNLNPTGANFKYVGTTTPAPVQPKIKQIGTAGYDIASSVATDKSGNVYVTGVTNGSLGGTNAGDFDYWVAKYDTNGNQAWIKQYGTPQYDISQNIATDNSGNFFVVGATRGNLAGPLQGQQNDAFIGKYDSNGNQLWTVQLGENVGSSATNVTTDAAGNVYVSGLTVNNDTRASNLAVVPFEDDAWLVKYDTNGKQQWFTQIATPPSQFPAIFDEAYGVATGPDGSVYTTGWTFGGLGGNNSGAAGNYDAWITKYSQQTGDVQWIRQFGAGGGDQINDTFAWSVATDSKGNVYDYGWTQGSLGKTITGQSDLFLAKYDKDGNQQWIKQFGASNADNAAYIGGLKIDKNDHLFLTGYTNGSVKGTNAGSYDAFVSRFDTNGNQVWNQQFGTSQLDYATNIAVGNASDLYVTGLTEGSLGARNQGSTDAYVAKLNANTGALLSFNPSTSSPSPQAAVSVADASAVLPTTTNVGANAVTNSTDFTNRVLSAINPSNPGSAAASASAPSGASAASVVSLGSSPSAVSSTPIGGTDAATATESSIAQSIYNATLGGLLAGGATGIIV